MKNILKVMFSVFMAAIVFTCISAFTDTKVQTTKTLSFITKNNTDFTLPTVNPVSVMLKKPVVEIVSIDTINIQPVTITAIRVDKKPLDKLLRSIKRDPKLYTTQSNTIIHTMVTMPKLAPLMPIQAYVTLMTPLPPILVLKV